MSIYISSTFATFEDLCKYLGLIVLYNNCGLKLIIRGERDEFLNPKCSSRPGQESCNVKSCDQFNAICIKDCLWCRCKVNQNTYKIEPGKSNGKCVKDEYIVSEAENAFRIKAWNNDLEETICVSSEENQNGIKMKTCDEEHSSMLWLWTIEERLMNIETLKCINIDKQNINMKPCSLSQTKQQQISCNDIEWEDGYAFELWYNQWYIWWLNTELVLNNKPDNEWRNYTRINKKVCKKSLYKGCYHFVDGSFINLVNKNICNEQNKCFSKEISAAILIENSVCNFDWKESTLMASDGNWKIIREDHNYFKMVTSQNGRYKFQIAPESFKICNGSLLRLQVNCKSTNDQSEERHCVLLKFETIPSEVPPVSPMSGSNSAKTVIISVTITILIIVMLVVLGVIMFYKRQQKRNLQQSNPTEEMQNYDRPSSQTPLCVINQRNEDGLSNTAFDYSEENIVNVENEYSYVSSNEVSSTLPRRPLPFVPSTVDYKSIEGPVTIYVTLEDDTQPVTDNEKLVTEDGKPVTEDSKPVTEDGKPVTEDGKPVTEDGKPLTEDGKPVTEDGKPVTEDGKPVTEDGKPVTEDGKPVTEDGKPVTEDNKPVYETLEESGNGNIGTQAFQNSRAPKTISILYSSLGDLRDDDGTEGDYQGLVGLQGTLTGHNLGDRTPCDIYDCIDGDIEKNEMIEKVDENEYSIGK